MKRQGLQKLVCVECDARCYMTLSTVRAGLPSCACGRTFVPDDPELAIDVLGWDAAVDQCPSMREFVQYVSSIEHGQLSHVIQAGQGKRLKSGRMKECPADPSLEAGRRVDQERLEDARKRQLSGLVQFARAREAVAEIPF